MTDTRKDLPPVNSPNFLDKVREALSVYLGTRGDPLNRGLTVRDLADAGLVELTPGYGRGGSSGGVPPISGPGTAVETPYVEDLTPSPMPTGFAAVAGITNIQVTCAPQIYTVGNGHARSKLYGATWTSGPLPVFANAEVLEEFQGTVFSHATNPATTWHLWLTWVTKDGVESTSPAGGTNGVVVTTGQDVSLMVEAMTGAGNPFAILTVDTVIGGVTFPAGTYSTQAFIRDAQITNAKIQNLAVDDAKVSALTASKLTAGTIDTGEYIRSTGYVAGTGGWIINGNGTAEFSGVTVRGTVYATAGQIGGITIASNAVLAGQTAYNDGTGFYLGSNGTLSLGNSAGNRLTWDGANLNVVGDITGSNGNFSGNLSGSNITGATGTFSGSLAAGTVDFASSVGVSLAYTAVGTTTLTVPANMTRMRLTLIGSGGGGGGGAARNGGGGGGGGAGAMETASFTVSPGQTFSLYIPAGGSGGSTFDYPYSYAYPAAGEATYVSGLLSAAGGAAGAILYTGLPSGLYAYLGQAGSNSAMAAGGTGAPLHIVGGAGSKGSGGGGGSTNDLNDVSTQGGAGGAGYAFVEYFDPNGVVLKAPFDTLKAELRVQGHVLS